jgi:pyridoxal biosynthesis lyase PdxS
MRKPALLFFALFCVASCKDNQLPKDVLPKEKMQEVLWGMVSAGEFLNAYILNKDSVDKVAESSKIYGQVFQIYHITKEQFDKSYLYYREHPELMKVILDSLSKKQTYSVEKLQKKENLRRNRLLKDTTIK